MKNLKTNKTTLLCLTAVSFFSLPFICPVYAFDNPIDTSHKAYFNSRREDPWDKKSDVSWWAQPILDQGSSMFCWSFSGASAAADQLNRSLRDAGKLTQSSMVRFDPFYNGWLKTFPSRDTAWESKIFTKPDVVFDNPFETAINQLGSELPFFVSTLQWGLKKMEGVDFKFAPVETSDSFTTLKESFYIVSGFLNRDKETQKLVKDSLERYGSLTASLHVPQDLDSLFKISDDGLILNSDENLPVNHQILLVGWDDDFEFAGTSKKGAWLIQNSWGTDYSCYFCQKDQGYLYVPYDDPTLSDLGLALPETDRFKYTTLETASGGAFSDYLTFNTHFSFVNRHRSSSNQFLRSVTFFNPVEDTRFSIRIYNSNSELIGEQTGRFGQGGLEKGIGMRTIELDRLVLLPKDQSYYVEVSYFLEDGQEGVVITSQVDQFTGLLPSMDSWILKPDMGYISEEGSAVELFTRGKNTIEALGQDFSLSWMDTGPNSDLIINLGSANEAYKGDLLNESRTTLSNLTLVLNEGLLNNFGGTIVGEGVFTKRGLGILNFSGSNHSTGTTRVEEGVLLANGYFASDVSVLAAGRLGGSGRINGSLNNGGIVSPGNSIGTLTVNRYAQSKDGVLELEFSSNSSDHLVVLQDASLKGEITYIARGFLPTGTHTLSANHLPSFISAKELTVDPDIRISSSSLLDHSLTVNVSTDGMGTFNVYRSSNAYSKFALSRGAKNSALILDKLANGRLDKDGEDFLGLIDEMQSAKRIGSALEIFNADPYCEALAVSAFRGRQLSNLLFSLTENKPKKQTEEGNTLFNLTGAVFGGNARFGGKNGYRPSKDRLGGFYFDVSHTSPNETSGISIGLYQAKTTSSGQLPWSAKTTGAFVSARGLWTFDSKESKALEQKGTFALISGRLGYEHSNVKRPTSFEGLYSPPTGKFDIASCALRGAIGYKMPLGNAVFTPTSYLENALGVRTSFKESGLYPLGFRHTLIHSLYSGLGVRFEATRTFHNSDSFRFGVEGFWEHSLFDRQKSKLRLFGGENNLHYRGYSSKDLLRFRLNAEVLTHKNLSLNVSGEGARSPDVTDFSLNFQLSRSF